MNESHQLTVCPLAFTRITCGKSQTQRSENRAEKCGTENGLEETPLNRSVPQTQGVYVCVCVSVSSGVQGFKVDVRRGFRVYGRGWRLSCEELFGQGPSKERSAVVCLITACSDYHA